MVIRGILQKSCIEGITFSPNPNRRELSFSRFAHNLAGLTRKRGFSCQTVLKMNSHIQINEDAKYRELLQWCPVLLSRLRKARFFTWFE